MSKISIITTSYKHQDFIAQTIDSILAQTFSDRELLIGDDSPDDATRDIIQSYVSKYPDKIKARHHSPNKGIVNNMNFLISQVNGNSDYIAFLEGDDMYTPENLEKKLKIFQEDSAIGVVTSNTQIIDQDSNNKKTFTLFTPEYYQIFGKKRWTTKELILGIQPPVRSFGNIMIDRKFLNFINNKGIETYEEEKIFIPYDYFSWIKIFPQTDIYNMKDKLFLYRIHGNNNSDPKNFEKGLLQIIDILRLFEHQYNKEVLYITYLIKSKIFALKGEFKKSIQSLFKSIAIYPFKNLVYKTSIILDILGIKKSIEKIIIFLK